MWWAEGAGEKKKGGKIWGVSSVRALRLKCKKDRQNITFVFLTHEYCCPANNPHPVPLLFHFSLFLNPNPPKEKKYQNHSLNIVPLLPPAPAALVLVGRVLAIFSCRSAAALRRKTVFAPPGGEEGRAVVVTGGLREAGVGVDGDEDCSLLGGKD